MQLLGPALLSVQAAEEQHQAGCKLLLFRFGRGRACTGLGENGRGLAVAAWRGIAPRYTMIRESPAVGMEEIMPLPERIQKIVKGRNFLSGRFLQASYPCVPRVWNAYPQSLVRTERGIHPKFGGRGIQRPMAGKVITRVVGRAHGSNLEFPQDPLRGEVSFLQRGVRALPYPAGVVFIQQLPNPEVSFQLEVGPKIERVAQCVRHGTGPRQKLLIGRSIAGAVILGHSIGAHQSPFVVVAFQPDLPQIAEAVVGGDICGRQMRMVVQDQFISGIIVV